MKYSVTLIYKCELCGAREMETTVYEDPLVDFSSELVLIEHETPLRRDINNHPRTIFHMCPSSHDEDVYGLCKFIGFLKREAR